MIRNDPGFLFTEGKPPNKALQRPRAPTSFGSRAAERERSADKQG